MAIANAERDGSNAAEDVEPPAPGFWSRHRYLIGWIAAMAFSALVLSPVLTTGFVGDDAFNSTTTPGALRTLHQSLGGVVWGIFRGWVVGQGRFFPLSFYQWPMFYALNGNLIAYKLLMLAAVLIDLALFSYLVRRITRSDALGLLAVIMPSTVFQLVQSHDAILSFAGLLELNVAFVLGSLIFFAWYLEKGRRRDIVASVVLFACALLSYEIALPFLLLYVPLALWYPRRRPWRDAMRTGWPLAAVVAASVAVDLAVRAAFHVGVVGSQTGSAYQLSADPSLVWGVFAKQVVGAVPLAYLNLYVAPAVRAAGGAAPDLGAYFGAYPVTSAVVAIGYFVLIALACVWARSEPGRTAAGKNTLLALGVLGIGLLVLPATLISFSPKWQGDVLAWGIGYLPVYVSFFGTAAILALAVYRVARLLPSTWGTVVTVVVLATLVAAVGVANFQTNRTTAFGWAYMKDRRDVISDAMGQGALRDIPNGAVLVSDFVYPWDNQQFYADKGLRIAAFVDLHAQPFAQLRAYASSVASDGPLTVASFPPNRVFLVRYSAMSAHDGDVVVGSIATARFQGAQLATATVQPLTIYMESPGITAPNVDGFVSPTSVPKVREWSPVVLGLPTSVLTVRRSDQLSTLYDYHGAALELGAADYGFDWPHPQ